MESLIARRPLVACLAGVLAVVVLAAQAVPSLTKPVNDFANVIDPASAAELERRIRALHAASGDSVVVATVDSYEPHGSIEDYAVRLFERAGIGDKEKDTGVLVVLAMKERAVRIEVGYGLEEFVTDSFSGETIRTVMLPAFREKQFGRGLLDGVTRIIARIAERRGINIDALPPPPAPARGPEEGLPIFGLIGLFVLLYVISRASRHGGPRGPGFGGRRRSTWSGWHGGIGGFGGGGFGGGFGGFGGGGGGGFGGFGGGMSGGGGASGRF